MPRKIAVAFGILFTIILIYIVTFSENGMQEKKFDYYVKYAIEHGATSVEIGKLGESEKRYLSESEIDDLLSALMHISYAGKQGQHDAFFVGDYYIRMITDLNLLNIAISRDGGLCILSTKDLAIRVSNYDPLYRLVLARMQ